MSRQHKKIKSKRRRKRIRAEQNRQRQPEYKWIRWQGAPIYLDGGLTKKEREVLYGGACAGGKSIAMRRLMRSIKDNNYGK